MALNSISSGNKTTQFQKGVRREYVREGPFGPYVGPSVNDIIMTNRNLKKLSIPLVGKIKGAGVRGSSQLAGNEVPMSNFDFVARPEYKRQGTLIDEEERELSEFDLFQEARPVLMDWQMELVRDETIQAMMGIMASGTYYNYGGEYGATDAGEASAANCDTWVTANSDRILYGELKSNLSAGDHTTSLATIDTTNDKVDAAGISLIRRIAESANPLIKPYRTKDGKAWYVLFLGCLSFRDAKNDTTIAQANREARPRDVMENPIFTAGDLIYDGVIIKEVSDMDKFIDGTDPDDPFAGVWGANAGGGADSLATAGNGSSRVAPGFLCGAQAIAWIIGRNASFRRRKEDDYGHLRGVGITMKHDIKKTYFNNKMHGMAVWFHSASADS